MVFPQAVLETVLPITIRTTNADGIQCIDISLTIWMRTLRSSHKSRLAWSRAIRGGRKRSSCPPRGRPFAGSRAFVSCFSAVVEAIGTFTGFAAEGEKIELVAVGVLAVSSDRFEVFVHGGEGLGLGKCWEGRRGSHVGRLDRSLCFGLGWIGLCCRVGSVASSAYCHGKIIVWIIASRSYQNAKKSV